MTTVKATPERRTPAPRALGRAGLRLWHLLALPVALILLWWWISASSGMYYMPPPDVIATTFADVWFSERFFEDALPSVARLLTGFALAAVLGVGIGVALGLSPRLRALTEPVLEFLRAVPPPVLVPLLILLAGISTSMKLLVIVSGCIWPILLNTVEGVRAVDPVLADTCRCYGVRGRRWLTTLVLRSASPQIMAGMRQALSIAIILMVISEMFASSSGLGFTIVQFQRSFAIPEMWSGIVLLGLIGFLLSLVFQFVEKRVLVWYNGVRAATRGE
ncbi:ABC-type nitrate/sulfonate/bicarbonate transport system permease component [Spinactinospora alkalitolerans]|uniref:ABC-type nitrate/sulfonate/bicarbonate transport system permease component n=1 Tax=Spinactinospora alkalitolerans TaxID=687207 RepID=A0A852U0W6_9ACTN|nr:ABC transporter permease [Spinactinospora alkalitolerans]NYE48982.1 ABC-type nitrate/sulfonate/bicarbonate transport system permease component [Spinactinospora alkalitolerans]